MGTLVTLTTQQPLRKSWKWNLGKLMLNLHRRSTTENKERGKLLFSRDFLYLKFLISQVISHFCVYLWPHIGKVSLLNLGPPVLQKSMLLHFSKPWWEVASLLYLTLYKWAYLASWDPLYLRDLVIDKFIFDICCVKFT